MHIISFDLDGTLITDEFSQTVWHQGMAELYAKQYGCDVDHAKAFLIGEYNKVGDGALEWYDIQYWLNRFKLNADWKSVLAKFTHCISVYPEVRDVLEYLGRRYELMIISNATRAFLDTELHIAGLASYFKRVVSATSDFQRVKKDREFYHHICRMLGVRCGDLVHVGDHYRFDHIVPFEIGIRSFYLDRSGTRTGPFIIDSLKELIIRLNA